MNNPPLNSQGNTSIGDGIISFDAGNHSISASYSGDPSLAQQQRQSGTFTVQPGFALARSHERQHRRLPALETGTSYGCGIVASTGFTAAVTLSCAACPWKPHARLTSLIGQSGRQQSHCDGHNPTAAATARCCDRCQTLLCRMFLGGGLPLIGIFVIRRADQRRRRPCCSDWDSAGPGRVARSGGGGGAAHTPHIRRGNSGGLSYVVMVSGNGWVSSHSRARSLSSFK